VFSDSALPACFFFSDLRQHVSRYTLVARDPLEQSWDGRGGSRPATWIFDRDRQLSIAIFESIAARVAVSLGGVMAHSAGVSFPVRVRRLARSSLPALLSCGRARLSGREREERKQRKRKDRFENNYHARACEVDLCLPDSLNNFRGIEPQIRESISLSLSLSLSLAVYSLAMRFFLPAIARATCRPEIATMAVSCTIRNPTKHNRGKSSAAYVNRLNAKSQRVRQRARCSGV